jgi:beta-mannosidase
MQAGNCLDTMMQKIGIRRARIVQDKLLDAEGRSFLFEINNIRIFAGGASIRMLDQVLAHGLAT